MSGGPNYPSDKKSLNEWAEEQIELARNEQDPSIKAIRLKAAEFYFGEHAKAASEKVGITIMQGNVKVFTINNSTVTGDVVVADRIESSFNKVSNSNADAPLKQLLADLSSMVAEASTQITEENKKKELVNDLESLSNEAILPKPRKAWYQLSAKGLMDAASSLGSLGTKMVTVVNGILSILDKIS